MLSKSLVISTIFTGTIVFTASSDDLRFTYYTKFQKKPMEIIRHISSSFCTPTKTEYLVKNINIELCEIGADEYDEQLRNSFINSAKQLKDLLFDVYIEKTPDVVMFHKGYFGLAWDTKEDDSIFLYSIPDGTLFFNEVGKYHSNRRIIKAEKELFKNLIENINKAV